MASFDQWGNNEMVFRKEMAVGRKGEGQWRVGFRGDAEEVKLKNDAREVKVGGDAGEEVKGWDWGGALRGCERASG